MAPKNKDKEKATKQEQDENADNSKSLLKAALDDNKADHYNYDETVYWKSSTGSLILDAATGGVMPSLWRLTGSNNSGKTPELLEIIRNILATVPNSKGLWCIAEGRGLSEENRARCGLKFVTTVEDWEIGTVFLLQANVFELFIRILKDLVKNNPANIRYAFGVDSVDGLILRDDLAKDITEHNRVAGVPMLSKKMLQSLSLGMFKFGHFMGMISQVTSEIKLDQYAKTANRGGNFSGGNSLLHGADIILEFENPNLGDFILNNPTGKMNDGKSKPIGQNVRVRMSKSIKEASRKTTVSYPIRYGRKPSGIWVEREIGDLMLAWGLLVKGGSWMTFQDTIISELKEQGIEIPVKVQGMDAVYEIFEQDPKAKDYMYNKFLSLIAQ